MKENEIKTDDYIVRPSDSPKWIILESPAGLAIDVELRVMDYHYDCVPKLVPYKNSGAQIPCSYFCCYCGAYAEMKEIDKVNEMMEGVIPLLQPDEQETLARNDTQIFCPDDRDDEEYLFKIRASPKEWKHDEITEQKDEEIEESPDDQSGCRPANHCVFLMADGLCAVHKYCNDSGRNWVQDKFNICTTFPLDVRPQDKTLAFMKDFDSFTFGPVDCLSDDEDKKAALGMPQIIDSMKYAIVDRYGEEWWTALKVFAEDYRNGKIDVKYLHPLEKAKKNKVKTK